MLVTIFSVLALVLGILMSLGHFMQGYRIYKRKSSKDVSLSFILIFMLGAYVWLIYGFLIKDIIIVISFGIATIGTTLVGFLKFKYDKIFFYKSESKKDKK